MSVETLETKLGALKAVIDAYQAFNEAVASLPRSWADEVLSDLGFNPLMFRYNARINALKLPNEDEEQEEELPGPTGAIRTLLYNATKEGLTANEIVTSLDGHIKTKSKNPKKLLYSCLVVMARQGKLTYEKGRYRFSDIGIDDI
jgi:hypothetical protein